MTVLVMYADKDYVYITADGRASEQINVYSDNYTKVLQGKDYIFGQCGSCADEIPFRKILEESDTDPWKMMLLSKEKDYKRMFYHFGSLVATKKHGLYHVERVPHKNDSIENDADNRPLIGVVPLDIEDLPVFDGSGKYHVQGILAGVKKLTPKIVESAIKKAYKVNQTIGGKVRTVKLKRR